MILCNATYVLRLEEQHPKWRRQTQREGRKLCTARYFHSNSQYTHITSINARVSSTRTHASSPSAFPLNTPPPAVFDAAATAPAATTPLPCALFACDHQPPGAPACGGKGSCRVLRRKRSCCQLRKLAACGEGTPWMVVEAVRNSTTLLHGRRARLKTCSNKRQGGELRAEGRAASGRQEKSSLSGANSQALKPSGPTAGILL